MWLDAFTVKAKALGFALAWHTTMGATDRERAVLAELWDQSKRFHLVYSFYGVFLTDIPWQDDDNGGLPEWFFEGDQKQALEVDLDKDQVEWVPAVGPAPVWRAKFSEFGTTDQLWGAFLKWHRANY